MNEFKRISVVGLGYIGLPTATILASKGFEVNGVDIEKKVVDSINAGRCHIIEPNLEDLLKDVITKKSLSASSEITESDVFLVCVPTPFEKSKGKIIGANLEYVFSAIDSIAKVLKKGDLIIIESTCPVGTTEKVLHLLKTKRKDLDFPDSNSSGDISLAYCPERVLPGNIISELLNNDRVIGGISKKCSMKAVNFYQSFIKGECISTNSKTSEMVKLTENSSRDVQIAFANELSLVCDKLGINVWELISIANKHPRVNILKPGPGVGGHCIAVDPWFIVNEAPDEAKLIKAAREINDSKPYWVLNKIYQKIKEIKESSNNNDKLKIAFFGISFKEDIDDIRESPSLKIIEEFILDKQADVIIVEPHINKIPDSLKSSAKLMKAEEAIKVSDINVILVNHSKFKKLKFSDMSTIDTIGLLENNDEF